MTGAEDEADGFDDGARQYVVRSLSRGLGLLKLFDLAHPRWSLSEVVRASGLHKATCYRLLRTLEHDGFLRCDPESGLYNMGPALTRIAILARSSDELVRAAHPFLERLVAITSETVDMTVWNAEGPMLAAQVLSRTRSFQPMNTVGTLFTEAPASHVKLWLAFGTEAQQSRLRSILTPDRHGTVIDDAVLESTLEQVRCDGVAFDVAEVREVFSVAAPVVDATERMVASIAVVASYDRIGDTERDFCAAAVRQLARDLSRELGSAKEPPRTA